LYRPLERLLHLATLGDQSFRFLFEPGPADEQVVIDCETTGLNPRTDDIVAVAAVRIRGNRILTSEAFYSILRPETRPTSSSIRVHQIRESDLEQAQPIRQILSQLLRFIGGRPIVGYYVDFDIRMLDKHVLPWIQARLPNPRVEVSELYYACKYKGAPPGTVYDLRFAAILEDLAIPSLAQHDALNDAVMTAMMYVQLRDMLARGAVLERRRPLQGPPLPGGC
jgi:DNA polymerase-3 subunit epsilon